MSAMYKPDGYSTVSPYLIVERADATITFLRQAFGAEELRRFAGESGRLMHAEVRIEDTVVMLADAPGGQAIPAHVHLYVQEVDAVYQRALDAGATSVQEPMEKGGDDPDRRGGVQDVGGTTWWISTGGA